MIQSRSVSVTNEKKCSVNFCTSLSKKKGMCEKHYMQMRRHGKITQYGKYDKNEIKHNNKTSEIFLRDFKNEVVGVCIIDSVDFDLVKNYKWYLGNHGYAVSHKEDSLILLHQLLNPNWKMTDHKDRDKLNNRRKNIRECNHITNSQNQKKKANASSRFKGVCWDKQKMKWMSRIYINKKPKHLGFFICEVEAAKTYDKAAVRYFRSFAQINFPKIGGAK